MPACPICTSERTVKNGHIHNGKQRLKCQVCGRQMQHMITYKIR